MPELTPKSPPTVFKSRRRVLVFEPVGGKVISVDLVAAGVIDPAKVTRTALQNAASIAGLMITSEAMISEIPDEKGEGEMPGGGMGM